MLTGFTGSIVIWIIWNSAGPIHMAALKAASCPPPLRYLAEQTASSRMQCSPPTGMRGHIYKDVYI